jgi:hypothetical protein
MEKCLIVVGYNNVRIYDIPKIQRACHQLFDAKLLLVTEKIEEADRHAADEVVACALGNDAIETSTRWVCAELDRLELKPIGVLPFSDRGVLLGATLATHFGLAGIEPHDALAGLDKHAFRNRDAHSKAHVPGYKPVRCVHVRSKTQFQSTVAELGGRAFVKPVNEGNSRGCHVVPSLEHCNVIWSDLRQYHDGGIIVEELIENAQEYSWDYVAGCSWITEKHTTTGLYRAEIQQIVPAPLSEDVRRQIDAAGNHMRRLLPDGGAYHNEIFSRSGLTAAVETNLRPAGLHIWDLAALSFNNLNPWEIWVRWAVTGVVDERSPDPLCYSGIRLIKAPASGVLTALPDIGQIAAELGIEVRDYRYTKQSGERVTDTPQDNSGFLGEVISCSTEYTDLCAQLLELTSTIESRMSIA